VIRHAPPGRELTARIRQPEGVTEWAWLVRIGEECGLQAMLDVGPPNTAADSLDGRLDVSKDVIEHEDKVTLRADRVVMGFSG
jgi:hypothetical protein